MRHSMRSRDTLDAGALARLLAPLLYLSESTILRNISRQPDSLPPPVILAGRKIWLVDVVVDFYPPGIGAAIRRAVAREFQEEISAKQTFVPAMGTIAQDLDFKAGRAERPL